MINNPVRLAADNVDTKSNIITDKFSRWKSKTNKLLNFATLMQKFPQLKCCHRFHPSPELVSLIKDALLSGKLADPLGLKETLLRNPGWTAS